MESKLLSSKTSFGALIRKHRLAKGYTQQQLADKMGIQTKSISFIERGINYPSPENIFKLAQVLDISFDSIFSDIANSILPLTMMR